MDFVLLLLAAYGLTFGLMNAKIAWLTERLKRREFFAKMLVCPYCTGFHAGWFFWLLIRFPLHYKHLSTFENIGTGLAEMIATAFASSAVCYLLDTFAQYLEDASAAAASEDEE